MQLLFTVCSAFIARDFEWVGNLRYMLALRGLSRRDTTSRVMSGFWHVGDVVRKLRDLRKWKQADLAKAAGINKSTVIALEAGRDNPERRTILRVCKALEITEADLYAYAEPVSMSATDRENWALWKRIEPETDKAEILLGLAKRYDEQRREREIARRAEAVAAREASSDQAPPKLRHG